MDCATRMTIAIDVPVNDLPRAKNPMPLIKRRNEKPM